MADLRDVIQALKIGRYSRIAVQVHDSQLSASADLIQSLQSDLSESNVSLLADSVTECCLDETSAEHYGSDCIVKVGHCCWFASQRLISYFVTSSFVSDDSVVEMVRSVRSENQDGAIFVFVDSTSQIHSLMTTIDPDGRQNIFVCITPAIAYPGSNKPHINWFTRKPYVSNSIKLISRVYLTQVPEFPRVAGRIVFQFNRESLLLATNGKYLDMYLDNPSTTFVATSVSTLYDRLVNRFGTRPGRVTLCEEHDDRVSSNYKELLRRYRGVESVRNASSVGLVVMHSAASVELFKVRDILSLFLRSMGKDVFTFSIGKPDGVKLGNFADVDCFVIMSCPESDYFESHDLLADCVSPFEALVAVESLDWGDYIITDYDEMLSKMVMDPPPRTPRTPRHVAKSERPESNHNGEVAKLPPARIEMGLRGIPSRYVSEPSGSRS